MLAWSDPWVVVFATVLFFSLVRCIFGGAPYLPSRAWYALCMFIPFPFVAVGAGLGVQCVPISFDWQVVFHITMVFLYCQIDLTIGERMIKRKYGPDVQFSANILKFLLENFHPTKCRSPMDAGSPALVRAIFEFNGALLHEVFWNVSICQNFINNGYEPALAILMVPTLSSVVHGLTCNWVQGYRCFPQFLWVALSYHASQNVLVPGLVHALWYFSDGNLLVLLSLFKRDWDAAARAGERRTPHADRPALAGLALIVLFYGALELAVAAADRAGARLHSAAPGCALGAAVWPLGPAVAGAQLYAVCAALAQFCAGFLTWGAARAGMDPLAADGDLGAGGRERFGRRVGAALAAGPRGVLPGGGGCWCWGAGGEGGGGEGVPLEAGDPKTQTFM